MNPVDTPALTAEQMIEVDRAMIEDYHIELIQMMENAGRNFATLARRWLDGEVKDKNVIALCGSGNNGGGGMVAARHLHNWGAEVILALTKPVDEYRGVPAHQLDVLDRMKIPIADFASLPSNPDLILDALIGYNLNGAPRGVAAELIRWANMQRAPILSLDTPSGLDVTSGQAHEPTIRVTATLTLALPKRGLLYSKAKRFVGKLYLADISVPPKLDANMGIDVPHLFAESEIVSIEA